MKSINKLQQKWGVGQVQFWLIMTTFALGGSLSGYLNKQILNLVFLEKTKKKKKNSYDIKRKV